MLRRTLIALMVSIILLTPAFAFIGPGFGQLVKTIKVNPVENTIEIQAPEAAPTPTPTPSATPTPEPKLEPTPPPIVVAPQPKTLPVDKIITCAPNEECSGLESQHVIRVEATGLTQLDFKVTPHGSTKKIEVYGTAGGFFHKITEKSVVDPDSEISFTLVTNEPLAQIKIVMPGSLDAHTVTSVTSLPGSGAIPMAAHTSLWSDTCGNGIGYSSNQGESHCKAAGTKDCCNWYQKYHVHDLGSLITVNVSINVDFKPGYGSGCVDTLKVYTSTNNVTGWVLADSVSTTSIDTSKGGGPHQLWATRTHTIGDYSPDFRYVKVELGKCYNDWSYVTVVDAPTNEVPTASFTTRDMGGQYFNITFNATASTDPDGSISTYEWQWGDGKTTTTPAPVVIHNYTSTGTYTVSLVVKDDDYASDDTTKQITIVNDGTAPTVNITNPLHDAELTDSNISVQWTGGDVGSGIDYYKVEIKSNDTIEIAPATSPENQELEDGKHTIIVTAYDKVGNTATDTINFTLDTVAPGITITEPANGSSFTYVNIGVYYTTNATDINYSLMMLDDGAYCPLPYNNTWNDTFGRQWCTDPNESPTGFKNLTDGWHVLHVRYVDLFENIGPEANVTVHVNDGAPTIDIASPANGTTTTNSWVVVNFSTPHGDVEKFEHATDSGTWKDTGITSITADTYYTHNFTGLPFGTHDLKIRAWDSTESGQAYVWINVTSTPNTPPSVVINSPVDGGYHRFVDEINFTGSDPQQSALNCTYKIDAGAWSSNISATSGTPKTQSITNITSENTYTLYVKCTDGTYWSETAEVDFTVDTTGPVTTITSPSEGDNVSSAKIEYSATDQAGIDYYEVKANAGGWTFESGETHTFTLSDGSHQLFVRAYDALGNVGNAVNVNITLDTVAPDITIGAPGNNSNVTVSSSSMFYSSSATDVKAYYQRTDNGPWTLDPGGSPASFSGLSDGKRYLYIKAVDYAGNENVSHNWINVDANGPTTYITAPTGDLNYTVDDINVSFYTNDSDITKFQYSFDGSSYSDAITSAANETVYKHEFNNVPEGVSKLYIRGVDGSLNYGPAESVTVNVSSIFTNLAVDIISPNPLLMSTPFSVRVYATNYNEENVTCGKVDLNLTAPTCAIQNGYPNPQTVLTLAGNGGYQFATWKVTCSGSSATLKGFLIYTPTNQTKSDSVTVGVLPLSPPTPEEEEEEPEGEAFEVLGVEVNLKENTVTFPEASPARP
ncbi:MAG: PKD domain-containing protein [Candidatus Diapherotrites archaeon]|nr:PKD domain-containing protein [Candidatus Diapherotrites archaeon]